MFFKQSFYPFNVVFKLPTMLKFIFNKIIYDMFYAILIQMLLIDVSRCKARWDPLWVKALYKQINYYYYYYDERNSHTLSCYQTADKAEVCFHFENRLSKKAR